MAKSPLSEAVRRDIVRVYTDKKDYFPGLTREQKIERLKKISFANFLTQVCKVNPDALPFFQSYTNDLFAVGIDAVPASLMYAYLFMKAAFPELRIGSFYAGDEYSDDFDCYVMPAWQTRSLSGVRFDLAINVESMQEMDRRHVDYFLALFDRLTVAEAIVYISNARDYVFKGKWSFPNGWQTLFQHNTPRSWSRNHPTLVFRKGPRDYSVERRVAEAAFAQESAHWNPRLSMLKP
jgi:hypothetical protein